MNNIIETATVYADAATAESRLRIIRDETEAEIAASLLGSDNPMTGKPHSATSAGAAAKESDEVKALRERIIDAERYTIIKRAEYEAAKVEAWAALRMPEGVAA